MSAAVDLSQPVSASMTRDTLRLYAALHGVVANRWRGDKVGLVKAIRRKASSSNESAGGRASQGVTTKKGAHPSARTRSTSETARGGERKTGGGKRSPTAAKLPPSDFMVNADCAVEIAVSLSLRED